MPLVYFRPYSAHAIHLFTALAYSAMQPLTVTEIY